MSIYHFHIVDNDAARRYGQQLANGLRPVWLAADGEKRAFVKVVDESG